MFHFWCFRHFRGEPISEAKTATAEGANARAGTRTRTSAQEATPRGPVVRAAEEGSPAGEDDARRRDEEGARAEEGGAAEDETPALPVRPLHALLHTPRRAEPPLPPPHQATGQYASTQGPETGTNAGNSLTVAGLFPPTENSSPI